MFAVNGYRQGFVIGALSFVGFFGGALVGLQLALSSWSISRIRSPGRDSLAAAGLAVAGQALAAGTSVRQGITSAGAPGRRSAAFVSVVALLLVAWMVAGPLASSSIPTVARSVRNSVILGAVDSVMPHQARVLYNSLRNTIADGDFPDVFGDLTPTRAKDVGPPDPALAGSTAVKVAQPSVVKVTGNAPSCRRRIEGSGFVFAPQHVMTNAHVVAGTSGSLTVEVSGSKRPGGVLQPGATWPSCSCRGSTHRR
jgi:hypothetical protein